MMNWISWIYAWVMYWDTLREPHWSRYTAWNPARCERCGWRGPLRWAWHGYHGGEYDGDVEASDDCPRCGGDFLIVRF